MTPTAHKGNAGQDGIGPDAWRPLRWLLPLAGALFILTMPINNVWLRMSLLNLILILFSLRYLALPWRGLLAWPGRRLLVGLLVGVGLYVVGGVGFKMLVWLAPALAPQAAFLYSWADQLPPVAALLLLPLIVFGEELFWRAGVALPIAARFGPVSGAILSGLAFAVVHLFVGPPLLWLAAFVFGTIWAVYLVTGRQLWPVFACHLVWDLLALFLLPYSLW